MAKQAVEMVVIHVPGIGEMQVTKEQAIAYALANQSKGNGGRVSMKVSEKGGLSVYGLGRWPVTQYKQTWRKLLNSPLRDEILAFLDEHDEELSDKEDAKAKGEKPAATAPALTADQLKALLAQLNAK